MFEEQAQTEQIPSSKMDADGSGAQNLNYRSPKIAMSTDALLPKAYDFKDVEPRWYKRWLDEELFRAEIRPGRPSFSMVIPPPNVTGVLHIGHALNNTLQDILVRYKRMDGYNTLWVPGTDHAGIATQNVVERQLAAEGLTRHDVGREKFIERVWKWKEQSGGTIIEQLKRLGCSCDWSRERFTMDEGLSRAVREVFVRLYEEGLIYQGDYIINWCPRCHTALADIEVEHEPTEGRIWYLRYPLVDEATGKASKERFLVVATTRPETMLGDTAVAVNPDDERYQDLIGKYVVLPIVERKIPIIADSHVDPEFGTGAVKVTPAHDFNDFEIAQRHDLDAVNIFDINARLTEEAGAFVGMDRFEARKAVLEELERQGLLEKEEPHDLAAGHCYRCKTVVEPRLSKQWFVKIEPLAKPALEAVRKGQTRIIPEGWVRTYEEWMTNIRDWCISRQIWWGHRIPAWTCQECGNIMVRRQAPETCDRCGSSRLEQETDVLDTWFSSALWPFSTLGWPDETEELKAFYPTSVLITSFDILFFWVARMMMMGIHFMKDVPFHYVYLHALVRDAQGQKMSKSKGNVIDPLTIMEKYGTDAVRFTLAAFAAQGRDIKLAEERIEGYRHFVNKIWNAARLILMHAGGMKGYQERLGALKEQGALTTTDRWILSRMNETVSIVRKALDEFNFDVAAKELYKFFWHQFCDWYLELAKPGLSGQDQSQEEASRAVALTVLDTSLRLMHPFMPFVTEELWHHLPGRSESEGKEGYIMVAEFPSHDPGLEDRGAEEEIELLKGIISGIRNIRAELGIHPAAEIKAIFLPHKELAAQVVSGHVRAISNLAKVAETDMISDESEKPVGAASFITEDIEIFVPLEGLIDIDKEMAKLKKEQAKVEKELKRVSGKLSNKNFLEKAPADIVEKERAKEQSLKERLDKIASHMSMLKEIG